MSTPQQEWPPTTSWRRTEEEDQVLDVELHIRENEVDMICRGVELDPLEPQITNVLRDRPDPLYHMPSGRVTRLESRKAMEQFLDQNPTLEVPTLNFCWANIILGFKEPTWETVCIQDPRQQHSRTRSKSPTVSSLKTRHHLWQTLMTSHMNEQTTPTPHTRTQAQSCSPTILDHIT